jgi:hypothetical protein
MPSAPARWSLPLGFVFGGMAGRPREALADPASLRSDQVVKQPR